MVRVPATFAPPSDPVVLPDFQGPMAAFISSTVQALTQRQRQGLPGHQPPQHSAYQQQQQQQQLRQLQQLQQQLQQRHQREHAARWPGL